MSYIIAQTPLPVPEGTTPAELLRQALDTQTEYATIVVYYVPADTPNTPGSFVATPGNLNTPPDTPPAHAIPYDIALNMLRANKARAHLNLTPLAPIKGKSVGHEIAAIKQATAALGDNGVIATTPKDESVARIHRWAKKYHPTTRVGLELGADTEGMSWWKRAKIKAGDLFPARRVRRCSPDFLATPASLASKTLGEYATNRHLRLLVYGIDTEDAADRWINQSVPALFVGTSIPREALILREIPPVDSRENFTNK